MSGGPGTNSGHGHVWERPDGLKARCGGPGLCHECSADQARWGRSGYPAIYENDQRPDESRTQTECLFLEVGLSPDEREIIVNHPALIPDPRGGHIVFSPAQARALAALLIKKAAECKP